MRRLIVKYFALYYRFKISSKTYKVVRASIPTTISFIILGLFISDSDYPKFSGNDWIGLGVLGLNLFLTLVYFRLKPVKREELDETQKKDFDLYNQLK